MTSAVVVGRLRESELMGATALVTGASSGIGRAVALRFAARGAAVGVVARRSDRLADLAGAIVDEGGHAFVLSADIADADRAAAVVDTLVSETGRLDIVVNCAGVMLNGPSATGPVADWDRMVDVNLKALMYVTKAALPHLLATASTHERTVADVVNISSIAAHLPSAEVALYNATKSAVNAATEAWRQEFTRKRVRFCIVEPGVTETEIFEHQPSRKRHHERIFNGIEKLEADDIADAVEYAVTRPARVAVSHLVVRPRDQV